MQFRETPRGILKGRFGAYADHPVGNRPLELARPLSVVSFCGVDYCLYARPNVNYSMLPVQPPSTDNTRLYSTTLVSRDAIAGQVAADFACRYDPGTVSVKTFTTYEGDSSSCSTDSVPSVESGPQSPVPSVCVHLIHHLHVFTHIRDTASFSHVGGSQRM